MTGPFEVQVGVSTLLLTACNQRFSLCKGPRDVPHKNPEHILDIVVARYTGAIEPRTRPFSFSSYRPSPSTSPAGDAAPNAVGAAIRRPWRQDAGPISLRQTPCRSST